MKLHIVRTNGWILEKISNELIKLRSPDIKLSHSNHTNFSADINYYINWKHWKTIDPGLKKSNFDIVYFTHFEEDDTLEILNAADLIISQSRHGLKCLLDRKIPQRKTVFIPGMGPKADVKFKKIKLGISGRPYGYTNRKRHDLLVELAGHLDNHLFQFVFSDDHWHKIIKEMRQAGADCVVSKSAFWEIIDYWLSPSESEGGPMDVINAFYAGIPVISRSIGYFDEMKTEDDIVFNDASDLLGRLKEMQNRKLNKLSKTASYTWDNYREWHLRLFREMDKYGYSPRKTG